MIKLIKISSSNEYQIILNTLTDVRFITKTSLKMTSWRNLITNIIKDDNNNYNNLSNHNLNQDQKEALNFESNY